MSTPNNLISVKQYKDMKASFDTNIKGRLGNHETNAVWFSFDNLKAYLSYLEDEAAKKGITISGLNLQMIASSGAAEKLSIAFTPTYDDHGVNRDFDVVHSTNNNPALIDDINAGSLHYDAPSSILNRGINN